MPGRCLLRGRAQRTAASDAASPHARACGEGAPRHTTNAAEAAEAVSAGEISRARDRTGGGHGSCVGADSPGAAGAVPADRLRRRPSAVDAGGLMLT